MDIKEKSIDEIRAEMIRIKIAFNDMTIARTSGELGYDHIQKFHLLLEKSLEILDFVIDNENSWDCSFASRIPGLVHVVVTEEMRFGIVDKDNWREKVAHLSLIFRKLKVKKLLGDENRFNYSLVIAGFEVLFAIINNMMGDIWAEQAALVTAVESGSIGAKILLALNLLNAEDEDYERIFNLLANEDILSWDVSYDLYYNGKVQVTALQILSYMYLSGMGCTKNIEKSQQILQQALEHDYSYSVYSVDSSLDEIREKLSHYKKGLFGGLRYVP